jgi:hypothetical protein
MVREFREWGMGRWGDGEQGSRGEFLYKFFLFHPSAPLPPAPCPSLKTLIISICTSFYNLIYIYYG